MSDIIWLENERAQHREFVGGKGANLARMRSVGLAVPPAFVVPTDSYREFIEISGLVTLIDSTAGALDYENAIKLERDTADLRAHFLNAEMPVAIQSIVLAAYAELGGTGTYVAVRSSGTAEDTAEASFAGLHDTYLDTRGEDELILAIIRCWASLWSARATAYRHTMGFEHRHAELAVVVQTMIEAQVAGVMFTANPLTGTTGETVINASWGLGESVVSGVVTPDEFILSNSDLSLRRYSLGDKRSEIVRDPASSSGTVSREVAVAIRDTPCLDAEQLEQLGAIGKQVMSHYDDLPQDIEWAYADTKFYVLQSRDVTGMTFAWDEDVDRWQKSPDEEQTVWSRSFADEWWTGAVTPLFYSVRAQGQTGCHESALKVMGLNAEAGQRIFKYYQAEVYWNASLEQREARQFIPRFLRSPAALGRVPPAWWEDTIQAPFSWFGYANLIRRLMAEGMGPSKWIDTVYADLRNRTADADGLSFDAIGELDDAALEQYLESRIEYFIEFNRRQWAGFFIYAPGLLLFLGDVLNRWYTGSNQHAYADLLTGLPQQTVTLLENEQLWHLAQMVRNSESLQNLFDENPGGSFFEVAASHADGQAFTNAYAAFMREHGHRGQADRDFWFPRRIENPEGDYNAFKVILSSPSTTSPAAAEESTRIVRESAIDEIHANLRGQFFGLAKLKIFKLVLHHAYRFLQVRDDERHYIDRITWSKKKALLEISRRLFERGALDKSDDYFFLSKDELYELLNGRRDERLTRAKITGRRINFERFDKKLVIPPAFLKSGESINLEEQSDEHAEMDGVLRGLGTSRGTITGPARIIKSLEEIGRLKQGDILVCQATDPGWTPVFLVIAGLVLETGGMLAHGSCLSREYGLPAVQLRNAMNLITEGTMITVDGETGSVTVQ
ncbi:MAG: phosphohistidine swiveling domain-containing protein [Gammaproteobacteria bacterium]